MAKTARNSRQIEALEREVKLLAKHCCDGRLNQLAGLIEVPETRVYSWSKGAAAPGPDEIRKLVALETQKKEFADAMAEAEWVAERTAEWNELRRLPSKKEVMSDLQKVTDAQEAAGGAISEALRTVAAASWLTDGQALALMANFLSQKAAELKRQEWAERVKAPQVIFLWSEGRDAVKFLPDPSFGEAVVKLIEKHKEAGSATDPLVPFKGFVWTQDPALRSGLSEGAKALEQKIREGLSFNTTDNTSVVELHVLKHDPKPPQTQQILNLFSYRAPGKDDQWTTLNVQDESVQLLVAEEPFSSQATLWSTMVTRVGRENGDVMLAERGITFKGRQAVLEGFWDKLYPVS